MDDFTLARALHIIGVVLWIGGVAFVTTVVLPMCARQETPRDGMKLFHNVEKGFAGQARLTTLLTGLSGFYMLYALDGWDRYQSAEYWWVHAMTAIWALFTLALFVLEPLVLHKVFHKVVESNPQKALRTVRRVHTVLLTLSLFVAGAAVFGVHGG